MWYEPKIKDNKNDKATGVTTNVNKRKGGEQMFAKLISPGMITEASIKGCSTGHYPASGSCRAGIIPVSGICRAGALGGGP